MESSSTPSTKSSSFSAGEDVDVIRRTVSSGSTTSANSYQVNIDTIIAQNLADIDEQPKPRGILKRSSDQSYRDIIFPQGESFGSDENPRRPPGSFPSVYDNPGEHFVDESCDPYGFLSSVVPQSARGPGGETYYYVKNPKRLKRCLFVTFVVTVLVVVLSVVLPKQTRSATPAVSLGETEPTSVPTPVPTPIPTPLPSDEEKPDSGNEEETQQPSPEEGGDEPPDEPEGEVAVDPEDGETPIVETPAPTPSTVATTPNPTSPPSPPSPTVSSAIWSDTCFTLSEALSMDVDPFLQCVCSNETVFAQNWSQTVLDTEATLRTMLPADMIPPNPVLAKNSCTPENKALRWLALDLSDNTFLELTDVERLKQRYTMAYLYAVWNGDNWIYFDQNEWLGSNSECDWYGIECNDNNRVTTLRLGDHDIAGSIPSQLGYLSTLVELDLSSNSLSGVLPVEFFFLANLVKCDLGSNYLGGTLPNEITIMSSLDHLDLKQNNFSGPVSGLYGELVNLTHLDLRGNHLTGKIPEEITQLTQLTSLSLAENDISGTVPEEIDLLQELEVLRLYTMELTGTLPNSLVLIDTLRELRLGENAFSGTIPHAFGDLMQITYLDLQSNQLEGTIPTELGLLSRMQLLTFSSNSLVHGTIPTALQSMTDLISAHFNRMPLLTGTVPFCTDTPPRYVVFDCSPGVECGCCTSYQMTDCGAENAASVDRGGDGGMRRKILVR